MRKAAEDLHLQLVGIALACTGVGRALSCIDDRQILNCEALQSALIQYANHGNHFFECFNQAVELVDTLKLAVLNLYGFELLVRIIEEGAFFLVHGQSVCDQEMILKVKVEGELQILEDELLVFRGVRIESWVTNGWLLRERAFSVWG